MSERAKRRATVGKMLLGGALLAMVCGCPMLLPESTFTPGDGEDGFGTLEDGKGNSFDIASEGASGFSVAARNSLGTGAFEVDEYGRLLSMTTPYGNTVNIGYRQDGSVRLSGAVNLMGQSFQFDLIVPAGQIPVEIDVDGDPDDEDMCEEITTYCDETEVFLGALIPLARDSLLLSAGVPSGNVVQDSIVTSVVNDLINDATGQISDFCAAWDELIVAGDSPCETND